MKKSIILLAMLFAGIQTVSAAAFQIGEQAASAQGMMNAVTALPNDASTVWFNPAGMASLPGTQVVVGGTGIFVGKHKFTSSVTPGATAESKSLSALAPHAYISYGFADSPLSVGLGINAPFGLETDWPKTGPFAGNTTFSKIEGLNINPNIAYKISDNLAVAVGVDYFNMNKVNLDTLNQQMGGNGDGWGANAALLYKSDAFNFGISYRSRIKVDIKGNATADPAGSLAAFAASAPLLGLGALNLGTSSAATTSVTLPDQVNVGASFHPADNWTFAADIAWVNWKTFDKIDIAYASVAYQQLIGSATAFALNGGKANLAVSVPAAGAAAPQPVSSIPENFKATTSIHIGAQWDYSSNMRARFGFGYEPSPVGDPTTFSPGIPDNGRYLYTVGYGYDFNDSTTLDLAYMLVDFKDRTQTASTGNNASRNGQYKIANAHLIAGSISHRF